MTVDLRTGDQEGGTDRRGGRTELSRNSSKQRTISRGSNPVCHAVCKHLLSMIKIVGGYLGGELDRRVVRFLRVVTHLVGRSRSPIADIIGGLLSNIHRVRILERMPMRSKFGPPTPPLPVPNGLNARIRPGQHTDLRRVIGRWVVRGRFELRRIVRWWRGIFHEAIDFFKIEVVHDLRQIFRTEGIQRRLKLGDIAAGSTVHDRVRHLIDEIDRKLAEHLNPLESWQLFDSLD
ncbi:hypothetical protein D3C86_1175640 [compost metagenome]